jgi:hypothetical protein
VLEAEVMTTGILGDIQGAGSLHVLTRVVSHSVCWCEKSLPGHLQDVHFTPGTTQLKSEEEWEPGAQPGGRLPPRPPGAPVTAFL